MVKSVPRIRRGPGEGRDYVQDMFGGGNVLQILYFTPDRARAATGEGHRAAGAVAGGGAGLVPSKTSLESNFKQAFTETCALSSGEICV